MELEYLEPETVEEAISLLEKYDGRAKVIAGGTDLMVQMRDGKISPAFVLDIGKIEGLNSIQFDNRKGLTIGAMTPIRALEKSPVLHQHFPILAQAASQLGSVAIRNVGTIGGNLCNASPSAETAPALLTLAASARIIGPDGERSITLDDFFVGPGKTVLRPAELLLEIQVPPSPSGTKGIYFKHGHRGTIDLSMVGVAVVVQFLEDNKTCREGKIGLGAVAPTPIRALEAEKVIKGKRLDSEIIERCAETAAGDSCCISDVRCCDTYREEMIKVFVRRALTHLSA